MEMAIRCTLHTWRGEIHEGEKQKEEKAKEEKTIPRILAAQHTLTVSGTWDSLTEIF